MSELKPCPFCGGEASPDGVVNYDKKHTAYFEDGTRIMKSYYVNCVCCGASTKGLVGSQTKQGAIDKWNTRAPKEQP